MKSFLFLALASSVVATSALAVDLEAVSVKEVSSFENRMPPLLPGHSAARTSIRFEVRGGGCAQSEDFEARVKTVKKKQVVALVRTRVDVCEGHNIPQEVTVMTTNVNPTQPLFVANPVYVDFQVAY
jgi:hypothetical protein